MKPQTASECLKMARSIIKKPKNWVRGCYAFDRWANQCMGKENDAIKWCSIGALHRANGPLELVARDFLKRVCNGSIVGFNDHPNTTHAMVLAKFDEAIELALASEKV